MEYKYISADNHMSPLWFPRDIWKKRISVRFADRAPRVVETPDGTIWQCDGKRVGRSADGKDNAKHLKRYAKKGLPLPEGSLPSSDPKILLEHMDGDKVWAGVFYGDTRKWKIEDQELWLEVNRIHNDYVLELSSCARRAYHRFAKSPQPGPGSLCVRAVPRRRDGCPSGRV